MLFRSTLPDGSGWDVLRQTRVPVEVRVLVLTAVPVSPRRLGEFRPLAYLPKPFPLEALLRLAENRERTVDESAPSPIVVASPLAGEPRPSR